MQRTSKVAGLVLSGGAALGAAHLGVLEELEQQDFSFDYIVGVSAGAIVGSLIACGISASEGIAILRKQKLLSLAFDFSRSLGGFTRGNKIERTLERLYENRRIEDLDVPLRIGVTDFATGERVVIRTGSIAQAVRASISVPLIFEPYFHPELERWFVDGGITQNLPLDVAINEYQGSKIFACDVCSSFHKHVSFTKPKLLGGMTNLKRVAERTLRIIFLSQQAHFAQDARVVRINPELQEFNGLSAKKMDTIIERGRAAVRGCG